MLGTFEPEPCELIDEIEYKGFKISVIHIIDGNKILYTLLHEDSYSYKVFDTFDEAKEAIDKLYGGR